MTGKLLFSPEQVAHIKKRRAGGESYISISKDFDCHHTTIRRVFIKRNMKAERKGQFSDVLIARADNTATKLGALARLAEIPRFDTRSLTGLICGDPLPERSALAKRLVSA